VDPERVLQIADLVTDALQVTTEEHAAVDGRRSGCDALAPRLGLGRRAEVAVFTGTDVVGRVCVRETVGEDLVEHGVLRPVGSGEAGKDVEVERTRLVV